MTKRVQSNRSKITLSRKKQSCKISVISLTINRKIPTKISTMISYRKSSISSPASVTCAMPSGWIASPIMYSTLKSSSTSLAPTHTKPPTATFLLAATTQKKDFSKKPSNVSRNRPTLEGSLLETAFII